MRTLARTWRLNVIDGAPYLTIEADINTGVMESLKRACGDVIETVSSCRRRLSDDDAAQMMMMAGARGWTAENGTLFTLTLRNNVCLYMYVQCSERNFDNFVTS